MKPSKEEIIKIAQEVIRAEAEALSRIKLDDNFYQAVELIQRCKGKVIVTGVGKSGIIGEKIASTLCSTGTPALFLHPADGSHGDLGIVTKEDIVLAISTSGETKELNNILPSIKKIAALLICITGSKTSTLAKKSNLVLYVKEEISSHAGLIPTTSCVVALALGDALAIALLRLKGFTEHDLAVLHPGGIIGRKLLKVDDLMHKGDEIPIVKTYTKMKDVLFEITSKKLGTTAVVNDENKLIGIITDGDLRRLIEKHQAENIWELNANVAMTTNPKKIDKEALCIEALRKMEEYAVTCLLITDDENHLQGIIHIHDILKTDIGL